jgi:hypothetical protein
MVVSIRTPVLNIIDAIWVSHSSLSGYPESTTFRANQLLASQDPVALDYSAAKYILHPVSRNSRHLPSFPGIDQWLSNARDTINGRGGLYNLNSGILVGSVTKDEAEMVTHSRSFYSDMVDFDGDKKTDILWYHATSGWTAVWLMNGTTIASIESLGRAGDLNWQIKGIGDFNGDGKTDVLWHHATSGWTAIWLMDGATITSIESPGMVSDPNWEIKGIGDFNGDGKTDVLWQHAVSGWTAIWLMNGTAVSSVESPALVADPNWRVKGIGDFDGDGKADVLWHHATSGQMAIWFMDGVQISSVKSPDVVVNDLNWQIKGLGDFNGDGMADILWHHAITGWTSIWLMNGETKSSYGSPARVTDLNWKIQTVGDFNGDGKADVLWRHATSGLTAIWLMNGTAIYSVEGSGIVSDLNWKIVV